MGGTTTWTKRDKESGEFMAIKNAPKKAAAKKAITTKAAATKKKIAKKTTVAKKFKGVRREKK